MTTSLPSFIFFETDEFLLTFDLPRSEEEVKARQDWKATKLAKAAEQVDLRKIGNNAGGIKEHGQLE